MEHPAKCSAGQIVWVRAGAPPVSGGWRKHHLIPLRVTPSGPPHIVCSRESPSALRHRWFAPSIAKSCHQGLFVGG